MPLTVAMTAMNRSTGLSDFYPFVLSDTIFAKLDSSMIRFMGVGDLGRITIVATICDNCSESALCNEKSRASGAIVGYTKRKNERVVPTGSTRSYAQADASVGVCGLDAM